MNLVLHVRINGRERFATPYDPEAKVQTARLIEKNMPALSREGRVVVFITDGNVSHLITASNHA